MTQKRTAAPWSVMLAIVLAMIIGPLVGVEGSFWGIRPYAIFEVLGTIFINALTLVVVPLVSSSIISGIARIGNETSFGRLGLKTLGFYFATTLIAVIIGVVFVNVIQPGFYYAHGDVANLIGEGNLSTIKNQATVHGSFDFVEFILQIVPSNVLEAFSHGEMLGLIFFSMLFGYALSKIDSEPAKILLGFWQGIFQAMIKIAQIVLKFLPIGVFCLVARSFAKTGFSSIEPLMLFSLTVILGLGLFMFIALPLFLRCVAKVSPIRHFKAMMPALVTAFSTSSSSASIPITLECVEKRAGVSNKIASLVVPLGTSINLSGSALYECVAALFVAQAYGIDPPIATQFAVILLALFASIGVAGVPAGSLVATIIIMKSIGLPAEGIGLFLAVDRFMDMARTTVNIFSDSTCAVLVAATEGEKNILQKDHFTDLA